MYEPHSELHAEGEAVIQSGLTWPASMAGLRLLPASSMMSARRTRRSPVSMLTSTSLQLAPKAL